MAPAPSLPTAAADDGSVPTVDVVYAKGHATWEMAETVAALLAIDPTGLGGAHLICRHSRAREVWLRAAHALQPAAAPLVIVPSHASEEALIGGLALDRSLAEGTLVADPGLLARADGGVLAATMTEAMDPARAALIAGTLDTRHIRVERSGLSQTLPAAFTLLLIDGTEPGETAPPGALLDRVAFTLPLDPVPDRCAVPFEIEPASIAAARERLPKVSLPGHAAEAITRSASALGVTSLRAPVFALRAARALAALDERVTVEDADLETAAALVLAPRMTALPEPSEPEQPPPPPPPPQEDVPPPSTDDQGPDSPDGLEDQLIEAVRSAALADALSSLAALKPQTPAASPRSGRSGAAARKQANGRPDRPVPRHRLRSGRIDLIATLRTAAPYQRLRRLGEKGGAGEQGERSKTGDRLRLRPGDLRVKTYRHRTETTVIFVVDASGSSALNRMGEAKGAIEHLLTDCYSRRDHVALIAVRGSAPDLLLPPTRALTRVKRALASLPSGGTTPLAGGLMLAARLADQEQRAGRLPFLVILSDGRGNVALEGGTDRTEAADDLDTAARQVAAVGVPALFFDTSRRPGDRARALATRLKAGYRHLPFAAANAISGAVRAQIGRS